MRMWCICLDVCICICTSVRDLEDGSKQAQVFEELPGSFLLYSPARREKAGKSGWGGVEGEGTDVLWKSPLFQLPRL